ncbi:Amidase 1 [Chlorella vulgaris]
MECRAWASRTAAAAGTRDVDGPLAGLAFAAKDSYDVLLAAGANLAGKAAMSELAYDFTGQNCHYGAPLNPAAPGHMTGGSSSGCAALVAAGEVAFSLGGDTAGSVRVPASFCGVYCCRPSHGRISVDGSVPLAPSFDTAGWFARDAELLADVGRALLAGSAAAAADEFGSSWSLLVPEDALALCDASVASAFDSEMMGEHSVALLEAAGVALRRAAVADASTGELASWAAVFGTLHSKEVGECLGPWFCGPTRPVVSAPIARRMKSAGLVTGAAVKAAQQQADAIVARLTSLLGNSTVLLMPTTPFPAPLLGSDLESQPADVGRLMALTSIASLAGLPQVSMPLLKPEGGPPVGVSIIGPRGSDEALLALAEKLSTVVLGPPTAALNGVHFTPPVCADMLPPGLDDPQVWRLRFIVQSRLAPGRTMQDHADNLKDHHLYLEDLRARGLLQFMGPFLTPEAHDCGDGMFCLRAGSLDQAAAIAAQNPFHRRGIRVFTLRPWLEKILD